MPAIGSTPSVAIIGASLSGCLAAIGLARAGIRVTLIERSNFPRSKACGEGLSVRGFRELQRVGLDHLVRSIPHTVLDGYRIFVRGAHFAFGTRGSVLGVRRVLLDDALVKYASSLPGVELRLGEKISGIEDRGGNVTIFGPKTELSAKHIVIADGVHSSLVGGASMCRSQRIEPRVGLSSTWRAPCPVRNDAQARVSIFLVEGGEVFFTPVGDNCVNVSLLGHKQFIKLHTDTLVRHRLIAHCAEKLDLSMDEVSEPLGASGIASHYRGARSGRFYVVGDACECFDPVGGMGMTHAVLSGVLASYSLANVFMGMDPGVALSHYAWAREVVARELRGFTRFVLIGLHTAYGRRVIPLATRTGIAEWLSESVHGDMPRSIGSRSLALLGGMAHGFSQRGKRGW